MNNTNTPPMAPAELYLRVLTERVPAGTLIEVRYRQRGTPECSAPRGEFGRFFIGIDTLKRQMRREASFVASIGQRTDVYVGCAPRLRYRGRREDVAPAAVLWADCDTPHAIQALETIPLTPTMTVASGSSAVAQDGSRLDRVHAYWMLTHPLEPTALRQANARLAAALGADALCVEPTRVLRVPGTLNFKGCPPLPTRLLARTDERYRPQEVLAVLPRLPTPPAPRVSRRDPDAAGGEDPLHAIAPRHYVRLLTGREPDRSGKIHCPFHEDSRPSFHVYNTPERGWTCFACTTPSGRRLGGDIYTLASLLWGISNRGRDFLELRTRLDDVFAIHRG